MNVLGAKSWCEPSMNLTAGPRGKAQGSEAAGPPKKKRKRAQKKPREQGEKAVESKAQALGEKPRAAFQARKPLAAKQERASGSSGVPADGPATEPDSLFALDVLRQRLHEKIQEARGQAPIRADAGGCVTLAQPPAPRVCPEVDGICRVGSREDLVKLSL
ncbi:Surfeit locus protein 6 [Myotis brandtii]|uniref:Surfeit locus protein 6 n=1 Tax=Myotis brandtii TaxID=109478 RepID=S7N2F7_MYOBR|nr:Surfeit locus protein 6 [Myotis brandtii]